MTRLEGLIEVLKENDFDNKVIDELILKYYSTQDDITFYSEGYTFKVYTNDEMEDNLYEIADVIYCEVISDMQRTTRNITYSDYVLEELKRDNIIDNISKDLNYFEEKEDCLFLGETGRYTVCELV